MGQRRLEREYVVRVGAAVGGCTLALTASFVGLMAVVTGNAVGLTARFPFYVLGMAAAFVGSVLVLDDRTADGVSVIGATLGVSTTSFLVLGLAGEGLAYAARHPGRVFASQLLVYFLAAGLVATGLGYWGLRHWREFVASGADEP